MKLQALKNAGLGLAMRESRLDAHGGCAKNHMQCLTYGYRFCPHCGQELHIVKTCPTCGKNFTSEAGFLAHLSFHKLTKCPNCNKRDKFTIHDRKIWSRAWVSVPTEKRDPFHRYECRNCNLYFDEKGQEDGKVKLLPEI